MPTRAQPPRALIAVKLLHTVIWAFFAGCVVAIPIAAALRYLACAAMLIGVVLVECAVLAVNRGRCPLTDWAARYTDDRRDNFDIYLPLWLARHNKTVFGTVFVAGVVLVLARCWTG